MRSAMFVVSSAVLLLGCDPPAKTASGDLLDEVRIEESFALSDEVKETTLRGRRLRAAVELMDRHGTTGLNGTFETKAVVASGTVMIAIKPASGQERRIIVKSCVQPNVCAFLADAVSQRLLPHLPVACKSSATCG